MGLPPVRACRAAKDGLGAGARADQGGLTAGSLRLRGLENVNGEWALMATNNTKLYRASLGTA
jgi:hypothetical protein